jgi:hypothetical protein
MKIKRKTYDEMVAFIAQLKAEITRLNKLLEPPVEPEPEPEPPSAEPFVVLDGGKYKGWRAETGEPILAVPALEMFRFGLRESTVWDFDKNANPPCNRSEFASIERWTGGSFKETFGIRVTKPTDLWCFTQWHAVDGNDYGVGGGNPEAGIGIKDGRFLVFINHLGDHKRWVGPEVQWGEVAKIEWVVDFESGAIDVHIDGEYAMSYQGAIGHGFQRYHKLGGYREKEASETVIEITDYRFTAY